MIPVSMAKIIESYECILFDAFGVLVDGQSSLPNAAKLIDHLNKENHQYFIVSNGSTSLISETAKRYREKGLSIPESNVITSGSLLKIWVKKNNLSGKPVKVLGPRKSNTLVEWAGAIPVSDDAKHYEALILCNQTGFDYLPKIDQVLTELYDMASENRFPKLVLPNPDLIYPKSPGKLGYTTGSIALLLEEALQPLFPDKTVEFEKLGKPYGMIFEQALEASKSTKDQIIMIGDQLITDIKGANAFGIDSALVSFGLTNIDKLDEATPFKPKFILESLQV